MKKKVVSILLAAVMLLGLLPTGFAVPQAEAAAPESVVIDFAASAKGASGQTFWADLKDAKGTSGTTKFIGRYGNKAANNMTAAQIQAYEDMMAYLWDTYGWTIKEDTSYLNTTTSANKGVLINPNEAAGWGLAYLSGGFDTKTNSNNGSWLDLTVEVEKAGYYAVAATAYYSANTGNINLYCGLGNTYVGGAYADILINGEAVAEDYAFTGQAGSPNAAWINTTQTDSIGLAYLEKGENTITINTTKDYSGAAASLRRWVCLQSMELKYIGDGPCECKEFTYVSLGERKHAEICVNCGAETVKTCTDPNGDGLCDRCGGSTVIKKLKMSVSIPGVEKQVARNTLQKFEYDITIYNKPASLDEVEISYETDVDGIIEIDAETHTFRTLKNGDVTVTVTVCKDKEVLTETIELTVADVGEDRFIFTDPTFQTPGVIDHWATYASRGEDLFNFTTVEDDGEGTGNKALKLTTNSKTSFGQNAVGAVIMMNNGYFAEVLPGHMYEMSFRVKTEDYERAPGAAGDLKLDTQMYDYSTNSTGGKLLLQINGINNNISLQQDEWTEIRFVVKAPLTADGPVYITPRIVLRPIFYNGADKETTGWKATAWFDDFTVREVGLDCVELDVEGSVKDIKKPAKITIKPVDTTGNYIQLAAGSVADLVSLETTNEAALKIEAAPTLISGFPTAAVQRITTEDGAELVAKVSLGGIEQETRLDAPLVDPATVMLKSMDVTIPGVEKQVARNTLQEFRYEMVGLEGEEILPDEVELAYETDVEGAIEFYDDHTFRTLKNGDVTVTVTATKNGRSLSKDVALTVADVGEERFVLTDPTFEAEGVLDHWATYADYGTQRFNITTVEDDGTGNKALKVSVNQNVSMEDVGNAASVITMANGYFAEVLPGHMYEMSFKVRTMDYVRPEDATADLALDCQMFDYSENRQVADGLLLQINGINNGLPLDMTEWTEIRYVVKAPLTADGPVYMMPRVVLRPSSEADYSLSGWQMTAWFDDFTIREVGFGHVELEVDAMPNDTATKANVFSSTAPMMMWSRSHPHLSAWSTTLLTVNITPRPASAWWA